MASTAYLFHDIKNFKPMNYFSKHRVQTIEMGLLCIIYEKLASISIRPTICHWECTPRIMLKRKETNHQSFSITRITQLALAYAQF